MRRRYALLLTGALLLAAPWWTSAAAPGEASGARGEALRTPAPAELAWLSDGGEALLQPLRGQQEHYDILIRGGLIVDGTGNPERPADLGIRGDTIVAVGRLTGATAGRVIDASGLIVSPGFIDMHSHGDGPLSGSGTAGRRAPNKVTQGITTVVVAPDGRNQTWPVAAEMNRYRDPGVALNVVPMVGHNTIRGRAVSNTSRASTPEEIERMKEMVRQGMEEGAWGIGAGPEYSPGNNSTTEELVELAKVIQPYDGFYYSHQRSQSVLPRGILPSEVGDRHLPTGTEGTKETIQIAVEAGIRASGTHIKRKGISSWGGARTDVELVRQARAAGHQVYFDHYPYETYSGSAMAVFPSWALRGGREALQRRLDDPEERRTLIIDLEHLIDLNGGASGMIIVRHVDEALVGKTLADVARERGQTPLETAIQFALAGTDSLSSGAIYRPLASSVEDNDHYIRQEFTATSTDGRIYTATGGGAGLHPRHFGAFPRKIAHYVREREVITLPFAIRSMTSLGAQIIGLPDRGYLLPGYKADVVIFDFDEIQDRASVMDPRQHSVGIKHVLTNGQFLLDNEELTGALAGRVLDRNQVLAEQRQRLGLR